MHYHLKERGSPAPLSPSVGAECPLTGLQSQNITKEETGAVSMAQRNSRSDAIEATYSSEKLEPEYQTSLSSTSSVSTGMEYDSVAKDPEFAFRVWKEQGGIVPEPPEGIQDQLEEFDVICGSGGGTNKHTGNKRLKAVVSLCIPMYFAFDGKPLTKEIKDAKKDILAFVLHLLRTGGTRFLREVTRTNSMSYTGKFVDIGNDAAIKKIQYAFKDSPRRKGAARPAPIIPTISTTTAQTVSPLTAQATSPITTVVESEPLSRAPAPEQDGALALLKLHSPDPPLDVEAKNGVLKKLRQRQRKRQQQAQEMKSSNTGL